MFKRQYDQTVAVDNVSFTIEPGERVLRIQARYFFGFCSLPTASACPGPWMRLDFETGKTGRNQDCYCGSEKKYKQCCGK